ncbi:MAG: hypothetical protein WC769_09555 [Thermodesulfovibrionales bacterium]|jgi:hypothetical protein
MKIAQAASFDTSGGLKNPLHKELLKQFTESHNDVRKRWFLEDLEKIGTFEVKPEEEKPEQEEPKIIQPILRFDPAELKERAVSLQKWEGIVTEVGKDIFHARLLDLTEKNPEEETDFSIDEVSEDDRSLIKPGGVFYWSLGYLTTRTGQVIRSSIVKFRRLPAWTEKEMRMAQEQAKEIRQTIGWGSDESAALTG